MYYTGTQSLFAVTRETCKRIAWVKYRIPVVRARDTLTNRCSLNG